MLLCNQSQESNTTNNYRDELLGFTSPMLVTKASVTLIQASSLKPSPTTVILASIYTVITKEYCLMAMSLTKLSKQNNRKQASSDCKKNYTRETTIQSQVAPNQWTYMQWQIQSFDELSHKEKLNVRCDELAKSYLQQVDKNEDFMYRNFPREDISIVINRQKVRSSIKKAIYPLEPQHCPSTVQQMVSKSLLQSHWQTNPLPPNKGCKSPKIVPAHF